MSKKLPISPDTSYILGIYRCNKRFRNICFQTADKRIMERFVKIAVMKLDTKPESIEMTTERDMMRAEIFNSKLKKLLDKALDERERIFKYKNEYSGSYFAGMFECNGGADRRGVFIKGMNSYDKILLERIGFHVTANYVRKGMDFLMFISPFSIKAKELHKPVKG